MYNTSFKLRTFNLPKHNSSIVSHSLEAFIPPFLLFVPLHLPNLLLGFVVPCKSNRIIAEMKGIGAIISTTVALSATSVVCGPLQLAKRDLQAITISGNGET